MYKLRYFIRKDSRQGT